MWWATARPESFGSFPGLAVTRDRPPPPGDSAGEEWRRHDGRSRDRLGVQAGFPRIARCISFTAVPFLLAVS